MQYILLIYRSEAEAKGASKEAMLRMHQEYKVYTDDLKAKGHMKGGAALESVTTATTVRVRDGKTLRTDGPFAETREQLGGYYFIEAKDLDEAVALAAKIPNAKNGSIEVRPIMQLPDM